MRMIARVGVVLAGMLLIGGVAAMPAGAHAELTSTTPSDGASLTAAPAAVTLTFGEPLVPETVNIAISNEMGQLQGIAPTTDGDTVTVPWPAEVGDGDYTVAYRVVSEDGHPVEGSFAFTVAGGASDPAAEASTVASPMPIATPVSTPVATPAVAASQAPYEPTGPQDGSVDWVLVVVVMAFGIAAFSALLVAGRRNARRKW